jgi:hypothetical protein
VTAPRAQLAYCTNVHPGDTLARTKSMLEQHATRVRELFTPSGELGIGLWLSAQAARELLAEQDGTARLRDWLAERHLAVRTLNGFPYGDFHHETVKTRVYHPHWADPNRSLYTLDLAKILVGLVAPGTRTVSISTVPIGWRSDFTNEGCGASVGLATAVFAMIYKTMPRVQIDWKDVWVGAVVTSLLFMMMFFAAVSVDVMNHDGARWSNEAAKRTIAEALAKGDPTLHPAGDHGAGHAPADGHAAPAASPAGGAH